MGSRSTEDGAENIYLAARTRVDRALRADDSLFTPGQQIWTSQWLRELRGRFLDRHEDWRGRDFFGRLEALLDVSSPEVYQLMGEVVHVTYLIVWRSAAGRDA